MSGTVHMGDTLESDLSLLMLKWPMVILLDPTSGPWGESFPVVRATPIDSRMSHSLAERNPKLL